MAVGDNLQLYYKCDETGGVRAESLNEKDVTPNLPTPAIAGILNLGVDFSGGGTYLARASEPLFVFGDEPQTINVWLQINAGTQFTNQGKVSKWDDAATFEYGTRYRGSTQRFEYLVHDGTTQTIASADNFGPPAVDTLYMVTCIHDPVADTISIRVNNGTPNVVAHTGGIQAGTSDFNIGSMVVAGPTRINSIGIVDELGIWRRALPDADVAFLFNSGAARSLAEILPGSAYETQILGRRVAVADVEDTIRFIYGDVEA